MDKIILKAEERKIFGRKVKTLRSEGVLPGNVYGKKQKSIAIQLELRDFQEAFEKAGETNLLELIVGKDSKPVLIDNLQEDPVTGKYLHVDFRQVDLKEKITAEVPVEIIGEPPAEKQGLGTLVQYIDEIEVEALPTDFPDKFEIDVNKLEDVDMAIFVKDLKYDTKKIKIESDPEEIIVKIVPLREEEAEVPVAPKEGEDEEEVTEASGEEVEGAEEGEKVEDEAGEDKKKEDK